MIVNIADFIININFSETDKLISRKRILNELSTYFRDFTIDEESSRKIDFIIDFVDSPFQFRFKKSNSELESFAPFFKLVKNNKVITFYHLGIDLFDALLRYILTILLANNNGFILHASAAKKDRNIYLFIGTSETGKSTIINLTKNYFFPILDDSAIVRKKNKDFLLYQSPLIERNKYPVTKDTMKINKVFILKKASYCKLDSFTDKEKIFQQLAINSSALPIDNDLFKNNYSQKSIKTLPDFINKRNFYILSFTKNSNEVINLLESIV